MIHWSTRLTVLSIKRRPNLELPDVLETECQCTTACCKEQCFLPFNSERFFGLGLASEHAIPFPHTGNRNSVPHATEHVNAVPSCNIRAEAN